MPELPDIVVYVESLERRIVGRTLEQVRLNSPFVLRTAVPPLTDVVGKRVLAVRRIGKRIALVMEGELFVVLHLMIAGRLRWIEAAAKPPATTLATFRFANGTLAFTEAGTRKRALCAARCCRIRHGRARGPRCGPGCIPRASFARKPHAQAGIDRPAAL
jgi:formamidopyrimidine-DNA glycosylase